MTVSMQCPKCNVIYRVRLNPGEKTPEMMCLNCKINTKRIFKVGVGEIVSDNLINASDVIMNGVLPSGADKVVF